MSNVDTRKWTEQQFAHAPLPDGRLKKEFA